MVYANFEKIVIYIIHAHEHVGTAVSKQHLKD